MSLQANIIFKGDCVTAIEVLNKTHENKIRMIYIDPPFFSGTDYSLKKKTGSSATKAPNLQEISTYSDKWTGGLEEYLKFMRIRLEGIKSLLTNDGSVWIHLDWHVSHYIKIIMDKIFGYSNFINEIIWKRTNSPKAQSKSFGSQHDVILVYAKDRTVFKINPIYRDHDERSLKPYSYSDEKGKFRLIELEAQGIQRTEDRKQFEWKGRTAPYLYRQETLDEWWDSGIIYTSKNGRYTKKQYLSEISGVIVSDLWLDIPPIQGSSNEYVGFLTQKPLNLLKRIIETATSQGDTVCDFFVGSGTTAVAAAETSRNWIVCDASTIAINLMISRLEKSSSKNMYELIELTNQ